MDEVPKGVDAEFILSLCGDTDIRLEVKGGHTVIRAAHIVFCSNTPWREWFTESTKQFHINAFKSRVSEFVDFKVPFPDIEIIDSDPEIYKQEIQRWANSIPTVKESQELLSRRGRTETVFGPDGCEPPKVIVNKNKSKKSYQEDPNILRLFINKKEMEIEEYFRINFPDLTVPNPEIPPLSRCNAIDIYKTPERR